MQTPRRNIPSRDHRGWYALYHAAILESDKRSALFQIECAWSAIQGRVAESRIVSPEDRRELQDLRNAIEHLKSLLQDFTDDFADTVWN